MLTNQDIRLFHRTAVLASVDVVDKITVDDLTRPTPCDGWNLGNLLEHMTVQHKGFAAAARGDGADLANWDTASVADAVLADPSGAYSAAAVDVLEAFAADDVLAAPFALPEFGPDAVVPGELAIGFHFVDYVVHGWDVARALGLQFVLPAEVVAAVTPVAFAVPGGDFRTAPGAAFGPALETSRGTCDLDRVLLHLGRSPGWTR